MAELKTLRVCLSTELPLIEERDPNFLYFLYDKLMLFVGQSLYYDPYAIVETMPEEPAFGLLYFTLDDGKVKVYREYVIREIAEIESAEQLEILKQAGTTFFIQSERRYLDLRRRIITLPFHNGTYELTVSLANNLLIDEDTVIGFNTESNTFEIIGKKEDYDLVFAKGYQGIDTDTVDIDVSENRITGNLKISPAYDNILRLLNDGLYANANDKLTIAKFKEWVDYFTKYKTEIDGYIEELTDKVSDIEGNTSPQSIAEHVLEALEKVYPEIDEVMATYQEIVAKFDGIEERLMNYAEERYSLAYSDLYALMMDVTANPWETWEDESTGDGT